MEEIKNEKSDIKEQISIAKEILDEKNEKLREAFEICLMDSKILCL